MDSVDCEVSAPIDILIYLVLIVGDEMFLVVRTVGLIAAIANCGDLVVHHFLQQTYEKGIGFTELSSFPGCLLSGLLQYYYAPQRNDKPIHALVLILSEEIYKISLGRTSLNTSPIPRLSSATY